LAHLLPSLGEPEAGPAGQVAQARLSELLIRKFPVGGQAAAPGGA
jgi:hypothetical protein